MRCSCRAAYQTILQADRVQLLPFGQDTPLYASPISWHLTRSKKEVWAAFGPSSSHLLECLLLGRARARPVIRRPWSEGKELNKLVQRVKLGTRLQDPLARGAFTDFTARYGRLLEEDKQTLREHLLQSLSESGAETSQTELEATSAKFKISHLLDMPLIALSNGQTRRARIIRSLLMKPELLILEEPLTGLDDQSRILIERALYDYHQSLSPQLIFTLRSQDKIPDYISHVIQTAETPSGQRDVTYIGPRGGWKPPTTTEKAHKPIKPLLKHAKPLVEMVNVNVFGRYQILHNISWTVREGERWLLKGPNGSGKSTLLEMINGNHPQSYQQQHLTLFSKSRDRLATPTLQGQIGHVSPEIFNAFPRRYPGLNALEAIGTGFDSVYTYRELSFAQEQQIKDLAAKFDLSSTFLEKSFATLSAEEQSLTLLLRALVKQPPLLILDEPFAGMSERLVEKCKRYLEEQLDPRQAIIMVTHFLEEKPASVDRMLQLEEGRVIKLI